MKNKVSITREEYEEYKHLKWFYSHIVNDYSDFKRKFIKLKAVAFGGMQPDETELDMMLAMIDCVVDISNPANRITQIIDDYSTLFDDKGNMRFD